MLDRTSTLPLPNAGGNTLPDGDQFWGRIPFSTRSHYRQLFQTPNPWMVIPTNFVFQQWPHLTRLKNWKTSFRREVITSLDSSSTSLVGRCGQCRTCFRQHQDEFRNPGFPNCERPHEYHDPRDREGGTLSATRRPDSTSQDLT